MMVPNKAEHIRPTPRRGSNYYYDPEVAAKLAAWVNYICPVQGAQEEMEKIDPSLVDNPLIFPTTRRSRVTVRLHGRSTTGSRPSTKETGPMSQVADRPRRGRSRRRVRRLRLRGVTKRSAGFTAVRRPRPRRPAAARSSRCSARRAAARPRRCAWSPGSRRRPRARSRSAGEDITYAKPYQRPVNTVFQNYALFPHLTSSRTSRSGCAAAGAGRTSSGEVGEMLELVELDQPGPQEAGPALRRPAAAGGAGPRPDQQAARCCCSTSRSARSTSSCAARCRSSSSGSRPRSGSPSSTSPTTRRRP